MSDSPSPPPPSLAEPTDSNWSAFSLELHHAIYFADNRAPRIFRGNLSPPYPAEGEVGQDQDEKEEEWKAGCAWLRLFYRTLLPTETFDQLAHLRADLILKALETRFEMPSRLSETRGLFHDVLLCDHLNDPKYLAKHRISDVSQARSESRRVKKYRGLLEGKYRTVEVGQPERKNQGLADMLDDMFRSRMSLELLADPQGIHEREALRNFAPQKMADTSLLPGPSSGSILLLSLPLLYLSYRLYTSFTSPVSKPYDPKTGLGRGAPGFQTGVRRVQIPPALAARIRAGEEVSAEEVTKALEEEKERIKKEDEEERRRVEGGVEEEVGGKGKGRGKKRK
ncbi:hypothetical protein JCM11641_003670 [Rhodosporidiobolus odoratus]